MISEKSIKNIIKHTISIQQISAPTFHEKQRADFLLNEFTHSQVDSVFMDEAGNVLSMIHGNGKKPLIISAHLDSVFPSGTPLSIKKNPKSIKGPGIGDNALGLAALLELPVILKKNVPLDGDIWLAATVGEEGLGNLYGMHALMERFGNIAQAFIVLEGIGLGQIHHQGLGIKRYRLSITTRGGHAWVDRGDPSAIHELAHLIALVNNSPLPEFPACSINFGLIGGGTSINSLSDQAWSEVELRSEDGSMLSLLDDRLKIACKKHEKPGIKLNIVEIGSRPFGKIPSTHPLVALAAKVLSDLNVEPHLNCASTDASLPLSLGIPAICVGICKGGKSHSLDEYIEIGSLSVGLQALVNTIQGCWSF